jgi:cytochrome c
VVIAASAQDAPRRSVRDGAYTTAQAERGERDYGRQCERCHGADLSGDTSREVPALAGDHFQEQWSGRTVKELFDLVKRSMPGDAPDSLTTRAYVDIVAYVLSANQFASGAQELPRVPERLQEWVIEKVER